MLFRSIDAACRYLEPIDVRNGEYVAYDSWGRGLQLVPSEPVIGIPGPIPGLPRRERLELALRSSLQRVSKAHPRTATMTLDELLAHCIDVFGYT